MQESIDVLCGPMEALYLGLGVETLAEHGVCLPRARLPIGENRTVVSQNHVVNAAFHVIEHILLRGLLREHPLVP